MGGGRDEPNPGEYAAELSQIDALNRREAVAEAIDGQRADRPGPALGPEAGPDGSRATSRSRDNLLLGAGHAVAVAETLDDILKVLSRLHAPDFQLDGQAVFGVTGKFLNALGEYGFRPGGIDRMFRMPLTTHYPAVEVVRTGRAVFLQSPEEYLRRFPATYPLSARKGRLSWAFLPLVTAGRINGVWLAGFRSPVAFTADERTLLAQAARLVAQGLERASTGEAELALSHGLRMSMANDGPSFPGISLATRYLPAGGGLVVGGDWFDSIELPNGRLAVVIGDVQGHDVHAAGLMAQLRTAVHAYAAEGHRPDAVLSRASRFLSALDADRFATCIYLEADPATGILRIARAGHPHPVLRMPDGTCVIKHIDGGLPLGLIPGEDDYPVSVLKLHDGETMLLCTDGLIESGGHDMYSGWARVRDALSPGPGSDLEAMADRLLRAVSGPLPEHDQDQPITLNEDDIALMLLRRDGGVPKPDVPERRLVLTITQDRAQGVSEMRTELKALLHDWTSPDQIDTAVLLASELLGNVLVHTDEAAAFTATVNGELGHRALRVEVTDRGDELPHQRAPGEMASSGRGLVLLDILSDQWSVRPEPEGKTVWFSVEETADRRA
ncbi:SpoIIE family protein phosphatase [Streptomyces sp. NPDC051320]|uniref:ATP-binding SpoIIE family protein phosphatase n=1 Tax=Streptomyces sp. NPDC051320 TaxID=3154644 RepID=UPI003439B5DD